MPIWTAVEQICTRMARRPNFIGYSFKEDMIFDGIENCLAAVDKFKPEKSDNPFGYFSRIAWNAFLRRIDLEAREAYVKHKNGVNFLISENLGGNFYAMEPNEASNHIIKKYEEKMARKKQKEVDKKAAKQAAIDEELLGGEDDDT